MLIWYPDYCVGGQCVIELEQIPLGTFHSVQRKVADPDGEGWLVDENGNFVTKEVQIEDYSTNWDTQKSFISLCNHHKQLRDVQGLTEAQVFTAIRRSGQAKEAARWTLKQDFMASKTIDDDYGEIDKEWPGAKFKVDPNGDIIIEHGTIRIPQQARQRLSKLVDDESKKIEQVPGISRILLE